MGLKFGFLYTAVNSGEYLWYSLYNAYQLCIRYPGSKIVIIEGADKYTDKSIITSDGLSRDKTQDIIRDFPDPWDILTYSSVGFVNNRKALREMGLGLLGDVDYCVVTSPRTVIAIDTFQEIVEGIDAKSPCAVVLRSLVLENSFVGGQKPPLKNLRPTIYRNTGDINPDIPVINPLYLELDLWSYRRVGTALSLYKRYLYGAKKMNYANRANIFHHPILVPGFEEYKRDWLESMRDAKSDKVSKVALVDHPKIMQSHPWAGLSAWEIFTWKSPFPNFIGDSTCLKDI